MLTIHTIDCFHQGVPQTIASYLLVGESGLALIETGPTSGLEAMLAGLNDLGYSPHDIKHVLVTHIHFDHAGAAGWWAQQGAHVYVHHVGARHMIDPSRLVASATRIYGDQMDTLWGELIPIPEERLTRLYDGDIVNVGDLEIEAIDTPGHATHHMVFKIGDIGFVGDLGGNIVPGWPVVDIPAPPPEFNMEVWLQSIGKIRPSLFEAIYPTHFGRIDDPKGHFETVARLLTQVTDFIGDGIKAGKNRDTIFEEFVAWEQTRFRADGLSEEVIHQYITGNPPFMSVDGIIRYWRKVRGVSIT